MTGVDMTPTAVTRRLRELALLCDLSPARRLATKIDMSPAAVSRRLRKVSEMRDLRRWLAMAGGTWERIVERARGPS
ncbi:MAG: hypothetical protein HY720_31005 [Planctomycetes bacterium]|nr:hypothetical protein [Planctomycetota bacterium]